LTVHCMLARRKNNPAGDFYTRWRYPHHTRLKSPG
jgi:hypothetical protein